jgi:hypothetical protein
MLNSDAPKYRWPLDLCQTSPLPDDSDHFSLFRDLKCLDFLDLENSDIPNADIPISQSFQDFHPPVHDAKPCASPNQSDCCRVFDQDLMVQIHPSMCAPPEAKLYVLSPNPMADGYLSEI